MTTITHTRLHRQTRTSTLNQHRSSHQERRSLASLLLDALGILTLAGLWLLLYCLL